MGPQQTPLRYWQRVSARTRGIITPGNVLTISGGLITLLGLWFLYTYAFWPAIGAIAAGRVFDILDGFAARRTQTSNLLGEFLDAATDKVVVGVAGIVLALQEVAPLPLVAALLTVEAAIVVVAFAAKGRKVGLHASRAGKYATFFLWCAILGYVLAYVLRDQHHSAAEIVYIASNCAMTIVVFGCLLAFAGYLRGFYRGLQHKDRG